MNPSGVSIHFYYIIIKLFIIMQTFIFIFDKISAKLIEILQLFFSLIGIIITLYGLLLISYFVDENIFKIIFSLNIVFYISISIISMILFILRIKDLINSKYNSCCYFLSIGVIIISLLGFIMNILEDAFLLNNMNISASNSEENIESKSIMRQRRAFIMVMIIILFLYLILILLSLSDNLRINLKIDDSYYNYQLALKEEMNIVKNENKKETVEDKKEEKIKEKHEIKIDIDNQILGSKNELNVKLEQNEEQKV